MGQAIHEDGGNFNSLHLQRRVGGVIGKVQQWRQPAPVPPDQAVQGIKAWKEATQRQITCQVTNSALCLT